MKKQITIAFEWWNAEPCIEVKQSDKEALDEMAQSHITHQMQEGYTSGELIAEKENGTYYRGAWSVEVSNHE